MALRSVRSVLAAVLFFLCGTTGASAQSCDADINADGVVNGTDLGFLLAQWGPCGSPKLCTADINDDGVVNGVDLGTLLAAWGACSARVPSWATLVESLPDPSVVTDATLREAITATGYAWRVRDSATQIEMVLIPPGTFDMGCSPSNQSECNSNENPVHSVTLTVPFYIGRYEVTQAQWTATMGSNPSGFQTPTAQVPADQVPNRPVERVSWDETQGFLNATGMRLPTEAEWEYAYRVGTTTAFHAMPGYPSGTNDESLLASIAWYGGSSGSQTHPVGQKSGNGFGLHDMSGNVWEWVNDWFATNYYAVSPSVNPPGPSSGSARVLRGGSWNNGGAACRSSNRALPLSGNNFHGFRVARNLTDAPTLTAVSPASGPAEGGTTITLTGTNLSGTTSVTVGGLAATSVKVVNSTTVTAVTPACAAGPRDVTATTLGGTATLAGGFTCVPTITPSWATLVEPVPDPAVVTDATLREAITATGYAWRVRDTATQIEFVLIPPGTFDMGCSFTQANCSFYESPVHSVTLTRPFYMGRYEVTQAQWTATMGSNPSYYQSPSEQVPADQVPNRPVERVSWDMIPAFLGATGMRLPTEAEWEYAYRAGTTTEFHSMPGYPNGTNDDNRLGTIAWFNGNGGAQTRPVGLRAGNGYGLHDMSGNVLEWVNDWFDGGYYAESPSVNPQGPSSGSLRVMRGGSWGSDSIGCRSFVRFWDIPSFSYVNLGFRVARGPNEAPVLTAVSPPSGSIVGGTLITLTGTNLLDTTSVTVGGAMATDVRLVSSTTVTAVTPPGTAGASDVTVTTPGGTATIAGAFTYVAVPSWATLIEPLPDPAVVTDAALRSAITATGYAWRVRDTATQIEMVLIPPGTFDMGCSPSNQSGCGTSEVPVHPVTLTNAFYMGRYEVTQVQWQARMGSNPSYFQSASSEVPAEQVPNRPVERVTWNSVAGSGGFMAQTGMRLPTEAEWEYAYRAGTTTAFHAMPDYPNGTNDDSQLGTIAWFGSNSASQTHPVGQKAGNGFGLHDMSGNVMEWINDWYSTVYYTYSPSVNPQGPANSGAGWWRVLRGGSWALDSNYCRSSHRNFGEQWDDFFSGGGFRVVRDP
jgi:formylglycine-generating enzyme required for sulfatase activity